MIRQCSLELGAGGGLVSLAVALGLQQHHPESQHQITVTDQAVMMPLIEQNVTLNKLDSFRVTSKLLDWAEPATSLPPPDMLFAADCVYFEPAFPLLLKTMESLIGKDTVCYFVFKKRRRADMHFIRTARKLFDVQEINDDPSQQDWRLQGLFLWVLSTSQLMYVRIFG